MTVFEYWSAERSLNDGFLQNFKRKKDVDELRDAVVARTSTSGATRRRSADADGTSVLPDLRQRARLPDRAPRGDGRPDRRARRTRADLVTSYVRDSALRLTQAHAPRRVVPALRVRHRVAGSRGPSAATTATRARRATQQEYTYSDEGLVTKIETFDAAGTVTKRQELTYFD